MKEGICIQINDLSKRYQGSEVFAVNKINLQIKEGEVFGILGPNGAGKTTFFSMLCGLLKPTHGTATICGLELNTELEAVKQISGVVPQEIALYPTLSGRNNLLYIGRMYGLKGSYLKDRVDAFLTKFGFGKNRNDPVKRYSGGMKRRINLIGGLLHKPRVLLLDEPTVGVDVQTRTSIMEYLKEFNSTEKITILYTSHYMEQAQVFCDRVGIIDKGHLLRLGTPQQLITRENEQNLEGVFLKLTGAALRE